MAIKIVLADYQHEQHAQDILYLLNGYALDPMGGGEGLSPEVTKNLIAALASRPFAFSILCYVDEQPAGLVNCFEGFSTFACKPLINIHDVVVNKEFRGRGISTLLLEKVEEIARQKQSCKITLEVLEGNTIAQNAYKKCGFEGYQLDAAMGNALFWQKKLLVSDKN